MLSLRAQLLKTLNVADCIFPPPSAQKWWQDWMSRERKTEMKDEKQQSEGSMSAGPTGEAGPAGRGGARGRGAPVRGGATAAAKISAPGRGCKHLPTAKPIPQAARYCKHTPLA